METTPKTTTTTENNDFNNNNMIGKGHHSRGAKISADDKGKRLSEKYNFYEETSAMINIEVRELSPKICCS